MLDKPEPMLGYAELPITATSSHTKPTPIRRFNDLPLEFFLEIQKRKVYLSFRKAKLSICNAKGAKKNLTYYRCILKKLDFSS